MKIQNNTSNIRVEVGDVINYDGSYCLVDLENNCVVQEFESIADLNTWDNIKLVSREKNIFVELK